MAGEVHYQKDTSVTGAVTIECFCTDRFFQIAGELTAGDGAGTLTITAIPFGMTRSKTTYTVAIDTAAPLVYELVGAFESITITPAAGEVYDYGIFGREDA